MFPHLGALYWIREARSKACQPKVLEANIGQMFHVDAEGPVPWEPGDVPVPADIRLKAFNPRVERVEKVENTCGNTKG